jgi:hypothetical protein
MAALLSGKAADLHFVTPEQPFERREGDFDIPLYIL